MAHNFNCFIKRIKEEDIPLRHRKIKQSKKNFCYLCTAIVDLNYIFALPALVFLLLELISTSFSLYVIINSFMSNNAMHVKLVPATATFCFVGLLNLLLVFNAADLPMQQVCVEGYSWIGLQNEEMFLIF